MTICSLLPSPLHLQNLHCAFDSKVSPSKNPLISEVLSHDPDNLQTLSKRISPPPTTIRSTYAHDLRRLIESKNLAKAKNLYSEAKLKGERFGVVIESMLVDAFMKSSRISHAFQVFEEMSERNVVTWTSMIRGCVLNNESLTGLHLFVEMISSDVVPNDFTFNAALQACADQAELGFGEQLHSLIIRSGLYEDYGISVCLIGFYSKCGSMDKAVWVFDRMVEADVVSFTSLISGYCKNSMFDLAVRVFDRMARMGIELTEHTVTSILTASGPLLGEQIHGYMIKTTINRSIYSSSALIEFYSRNYDLESARLIFDKLDHKNVVTWSSMMSCCLQNERAKDALELFDIMVCEGVKPNQYTFTTAIGACGLCSESVKLGHQLHCLVIKLSLVSNNHVSNALITMYSRSSEIEDLDKVFQRSEAHDTTSWCAAISGYFQNGMNQRSIMLLFEMHRKGYTPNEYGLASALSSCANLTLVDQGRQLHCLALKTGCDSDVCTGNALVNMYGKCGCLDDARLVFDVMPTHDIMSWNSLIRAYAHHGRGHTTIGLFNEMVKLNNLDPDASTFLSILLACNHMGFVNEAIEYLKIMRNLYGIVPTSSHYACLVDMMGRAGWLREAFLIVEEMPFELDVSIWKTLLGSCRLHGNLELGKLAAAKVLELSPEDSAGYVLLSNLHSMHGEWGDTERVRIMMEEKGVKKDAGWSSIEVRSEVHVFVARDIFHPQSKIIYQRLEELFEVMKDEGYSIDVV